MLLVLMERRKEASIAQRCCNSCRIRHSFLSFLLCAVCTTRFSYQLLSHSLSIYIYVHIHILYICVYTYMYIYIIYIYIHIHDTYMYVYIYTCASPFSLSANVKTYNYVNVLHVKNTTRPLASLYLD